MNKNIDLQKIADQLEFDFEDVQMLMEVFLESAEESLTSLKLAIEKNDFENIFHCSHTIKGSAANLLLTDISDLAKSIESDARESISSDYLEKFILLKNSIDDIKI